MSGLSISRLTPEEIRIGIVAAIIIPIVALLPLFDNGFYLSLVGQHHALCGAVHGMDIVLRPDPLRLAGDGCLLRHRDLCRRARHRHPALPAAGLDRRGRCGPAGRHRRRGDVAHLGRLFLSSSRWGSPKLVRQLVSWSQSKFAGSMGLYVFTDFRRGAHLLDAACPHGRRVPDGVD